MKKLLTISVLFFCCCFNSIAGDSTEVLLLNPKIQFECGDAIADMYNFNFKKAEQKFTWMMQEYPNHPLPYFLMGLSNWWKIMPYDEMEDFDEDFHKYLDKSIELAEALKKKNPKNPEASFLIGSAYGLKARRHSDKNNYIAAAFATKKALNNVIETDEKLSSEFLLGTALYNYFREWIPKEKPILKPIVMMFPKGDKAKGIKMLEKVSTEAFYTRIEAMHFLIMIYEYEHRYRDAFPIAKYLVEEFPNNPYFEKKYMKLSFSTGMNSEGLKTVAKDVLFKFDNKQFGYESINARFASFYLADKSIQEESEISVQNKVIADSNSKAKSINKHLAKTTASALKYNKRINYKNRNIVAFNERVNKKNKEINPTSLSSWAIQYNKTISKKNKDIVHYNKRVKKYNKVSNGRQKKYLKLLKLTSDAPPKIKYSEESIELLERTIEFGNELGYQKKGYHQISVYLLGRIYWDKGDLNKASSYYKTLLKITKPSHKLNKAAVVFFKRYKQQLR